jgi:hypothetical protein
MYSNKVRVIDRLIHGVAAGSDLTAEEILDMLWLSATRATPQTVPSAAAPADPPVRGSPADEHAPEPSRIPPPHQRCLIGTTASCYCCGCRVVIPAALAMTLPQTPTRSQLRLPTPAGRPVSGFPRPRSGYLVRPRPVGDDRVVVRGDAHRANPGATATLLGRDRDR